MCTSIYIVRYTETKNEKKELSGVGRDRMRDWNRMVRSSVLRIHKPDIFVFVASRPVNLSRARASSRAHCFSVLPRGSFTFHLSLSLSLSIFLLLAPAMITIVLSDKPLAASIAGVQKAKHALRRTSQSTIRIVTSQFSDRLILRALQPVFRIRISTCTINHSLLCK